MDNDYLEKIEIIREKTGVTYKKAKEALDAANGNVVDAIIAIEEEGHKTGWTESFTVKGGELIDKLKEIIRQGNISRLRVKKDNKVYLDIPVTAGAISVLLLPQIAALGTAIALFSQCTIEVQRPQGFADVKTSEEKEK